YTRGQVAPPDLNESFQIAKVDVTDDRYFQSEAARGLIPSNHWPERPAALKAVYTKYYLRMAALAADLMRLSALALGLPETYFDDKIDRHISRLNVRLYPEQKIAPLPGQLRAAAHTDYGTVTILKPGDSVGGLQIADPDGNWHDVPMIPGSFVINQSGRPDGALDKRSLALNFTSRRQSSRRGQGRIAAPIHRVLSPS